MFFKFLSLLQLNVPYGALSSFILGLVTPFFNLAADS